jgi:TonB-linked SusC/RagA family outer membrane protein
MKKIFILFTFLLITGSFVIAQTVQITGTVKSQEDGTAIPGVNVLVKGTTIGSFTDADGAYQITVPESATTLVFSFIGMISQEVSINGRKVIDVALVTDVVTIDEVVVIAYGTSTKSSFTGSVDKVKADQIAKIQTASPAKALEGVAAGVQVTGGTGQPGSSANIRIRGIGSVNASSSPLYVVDGAPYDGSLNSINTNDIESISVLKDATSAALYGARGANGVIIITTKKGTAGKPTINLRASLGAVSRAIPEYDRVVPKDYYELMWEGWYNALVIANGFTPANAAALASGNTTSGIVNKLGGYNTYDVANDALVGLDGKLNSAAHLLYYDDWNENLARTGLRQDYNLSLSGGNDKGSYFASVAYLNEQGMVKWSDYDRFTGRVGAEAKVNKWLKMDVSLSGAKSKQAGFLAEGTYTTNPFYYGRMMGPIYPIWQRDASGNIVLDANNNRMFDLGGGTSIYKWAGHTRPYAPNSNLMLTLPLDERSTDLGTFSARVGTEITFLKDFKFRFSGNTDQTNYFLTTYQNYQYADAEAVKGRSTKEYRKVNSYTFNQILSWNRSFGFHKVSLMAGHENYQYNWENVSATRTGFTIRTTQLVAGSVAEGSSSYADVYALEGYLFRGDYSFSDKYYFSGSYRTDGSSRFYKDVRWGSFWSLGGSWRISKEPFMERFSWINDLKLKASFGEQGNDDIGNYYGWQSLFSISGRNNGNYNGAIHIQLENKSLQWEKNANLNVGVEFVFLNRISGTIEYFVRNSSNLLFSVPLPQSTGISSKWENIGSMNNKGFEVELGVDIIKARSLIWNLGINATTYKNKITKMPLGTDGKPQEIISGTKKLSEGHSIYDFWLRGWAGVDPSDGSALYYKEIKDSEGNVTGTETTKDQNAASYYYSGSSIPDIYGGITNSLSYKGFELSALVTYSVGGKMYDSNWAGLMHPGSFGTAWSTDILDRWQKPGDKTNVPRLQNSYTAAFSPASRYLTNASFISLRNVTLSYSFPLSIASALDMSMLRVFATGDNLGLISKRKGMDPQQSFAGTADFTYVPSRIISFGVNLTF